MSTAQSTQSHDCILLELPGEIRNLIYSFATESHVITLFPPEQEKKSGKVKVKFASPSNSDEKPTRQFLSLTRVCQQIREEFLPIYILNNTVHVRFYDLQAYLDFVAPLHIDRSGTSKDARIYGNIAIDLYRRPNDSTDFRRTINLPPILKQVKGHPNLHIRCGVNGCKCRMCGPGNWAGVSAPLDPIFDAKDNAKLRTYMTDAVTSLELSYPPRLTFYIREPYWQKFMNYTRPQGEHKEASKAWCEDLGLCMNYEFGCVRFGHPEDFGEEPW
ncbi:hypothetical protein CC86DRAFT_462782 [Ophiobolus disseminans]|uniref:F-box domain-containing protein n=1 Tax=Ophiobolus disseminans TaxID=1469910 RepID=A0A6A7AIK2_9PLEO|nr:hypothetical protein CC86DRAFT_462782 [Ophiobolus disseminans]